MSDLNFFATLNTGKKSSKNKKLAVIIVLSSLVFLLAGAYVFTELMASSIKTDTKTMQLYLKSEEIVKKQKEVTEKRKKLEVMKYYFNSVQLIDSGLQSMDNIDSSLIESINKALPTGLFFASLRMEQININIKGMAKGRVEVAELVYNLKQLGLFEDVYLKGLVSKSKTSTNVEFEIECRLKEVVKK